MITDYSFTCWDFAQTIFEYLWKIISISYIDIVKRRSKLQGNSFISKSKLVNIETLKEGIKSRSILKSISNKDEDFVEI